MGFRVTVIVDDRSNVEGLVAGHGLAIHVQSAKSSVLFDAGLSASPLAANGPRLGIDFESLDAVVVSHGHYDHTGGIEWVLGKCSRAKVFLHSGAIITRFSLREGSQPASVGMPEACVAAVRRAAGRVVWTAGHTEVAEGVHVTGPIPRENPVESPTHCFFLDAQGETPDEISDDQALWLRSRAGTVAILGCTHAGVANTLGHVSRQAGDNRVYAVIGGMHLGSADEAQVQAAAQALRRHEVQVLAPCHCTGKRAQAILEQTFPREYQACSCGWRADFP